MLSKNGRPETIAENGKFPAKMEGLESLRFQNEMKKVFSFAVDPSANTPCLRRQFSARRNKRLGVFVPRCLPDGGYDKVQCHGSVCFCMDEEGEEVPGTRVYRYQALNCTGKLPLPTGNHSRFISQ